MFWGQVWLFLIQFSKNSITQGAWDPLQSGWGAGLQHVYTRRLDVLPRGFSGIIPLVHTLLTIKDTPPVTGLRNPRLMIEHAKVLLPQIIPKEIAKDGSKIRLLLLFFGANDSTLKGAPQHVHSPVKERRLF